MEISTGFLKAFHAGKNFGKSDFAALPPKSIPVTPLVTLPQHPKLSNTGTFRNVPVLSKTGTYQYLGPKVYFLISYLLV